VRSQRIEILRLATPVSLWPDPGLQAQAVAELSERYRVEACGPGAVPKGGDRERDGTERTTRGCCDLGASREPRLAALSLIAAAGLARRRRATDQRVCARVFIMPGSVAGLAVLAVQAADHQLDAEGELVVHVAPAAEQHGEPEQVVGGVAGNLLDSPAHLGKIIGGPRTARGASSEARRSERVPVRIRRPVSVRWPCWRGAGC
jgi:hypothetical protein